MPVGERKPDAPLDRSARNDDLRSDERSGVLLRETVDQLIEQDVEAVGECDSEHRRAFRSERAIIAEAGLTG
jgi:hypothetical protein